MSRPLGRSRYPNRWIARVKGALKAGIKPKQIAYWTGIPLDTVKEWAAGDRADVIEADETVIHELRVLLLKEN